MAEENEKPDVTELDARFTCPSCGRRLQIAAGYDDGWEFDIKGMEEYIEKKKER